MADDIKYWMIFCTGIFEGEDNHFVTYYTGKEILSQYLLEDLEDIYNFQSVQINGYVRIEKSFYDRKVNV